MAVLSALSSFAIPNIINTVKLSRIEETKALMNSYAADCLGQYRVSTDITELKEKVPEYLSDQKLATLGYQLDPKNNNCETLAVKPLNNKDKDLLYEMQFRIYEDDKTGSVKVFKGATPSDSPNPRSLPSCRGWAGENCGLSEEAQARIDRLNLIAEERNKCTTNFNNKQINKATGPVKTWRAPVNDEDMGACEDQGICLFEGKSYRSCDEVEVARQKKYGDQCKDWTKDMAKQKNNKKSEEGEGQTLDPQCGGQLYWFHSGDILTSFEEWEEKNEDMKKSQCEKDRSRIKTTSHKGEYVIKPADGIKEPCGNKIFVYDGEILNSVDYDAKLKQIEADKKKREEDNRNKQKKEKETDKRGNICPKKTYTDNQGLKCCPSNPTKKCNKDKKYRKKASICGCWYKQK